MITFLHPVDLAELCRRDTSFVLSVFEVTKSHDPKHAWTGPDKVRELIMGMLNPDPEQRTTIDKIVRQINLLKGLCFFSFCFKYCRYCRVLPNLFPVLL